MSATAPAAELAGIDFTAAVADAAAIRAVNPHRHELDLLTAVVHIDRPAHKIVGYKDTTAGDFWTRGHFPRFPVFPGVLMCEAAAQLCNYYAVSQGFVGADKVMGLGGLEDVRFRGMVRPGDRLVLHGTGLRVSARMTKFAVAGFVARPAGFDPAFEAVVIGVPIGTWEDVTRA